MQRVLPGQKTWRRLLLAIGWFVLFTDDQSRSQMTDRPVRLKTSTSKVNLSFHATDEHGRSIEDLQLSDLSLRDDHQKPSRVLSFEHQVNAAIRAGILVDTSASMFGLTRHQQIAQRYVEGVLRTSTDRASVTRFDLETALRQDWTISPSDDLSRKIVRPLATIDVASGRSSRNEGMEP